MLQQKPAVAVAPPPVSTIPAVRSVPAWSTPLDNLAERADKRPHPDASTESVKNAKRRVGG